MTSEQILKEIERIDQEIKGLKENRCEGLVCTGKEHERSLKIQDLLDERTELYYKLDFPNGKKVTKSKGSLEDRVRIQEKKDIAKKLLDILDDEMISAKVGLTIEEVQSLRS